MGDLMIVDNGMEIPADGFLVKSSEITADESAMTGNSPLFIPLNIQNFFMNFLFSRWNIAHKKRHSRKLRYIPELNNRWRRQRLSRGPWRPLTYHAIRKQSSFWRGINGGNSCWKILSHRQNIESFEQWRWKSHSTVNEVGTYCWSKFK